MARKTCTLFLLFMQLHLYAQVFDFTNYPGLYSNGTLPEDFTILSSAKYAEEKQNIDYTDSRKERKTQDQFYLESNFYEDRLLHSGRIVFGDPVTNYLNDIKSEILKQEPALNKEIRIYTYRSADANAYTFNNGVVVVTTGLLAQAENEAQIAFILCHEFNHYIEKHAMSSYVESKRMERGAGIYKNLDPQDVILAQFSYSKDLETEADEKGVKLFKKTNYSTTALETAFDVLLYSYLPFDEIAFEKTYFNHATYIIPEEYFLDTVKSISAEEDYDDESSTHPNIKKRKQEALEIMGTIDNAQRQDFIVSEERFREVQKICRFESVKLYLTDRSYENAFYANYLLMLDDPENPYLKKNMAKALYGISTYKTDRSYTTSVHTSYKRIEGEQQQFYFLADKLPAKDFSILALQVIWPVYKMHTEDKELQRMVHDLMHNIVFDHKLKEKDFKKEYAVVKTDSVIAVPQDTAEVVQESSKTKSKYQKIKEEKETKEIVVKFVEESYWRYAFVELLKDPEFEKQLQAAEEEEDIAELTESSDKKSNKKNNEYALGLNKIVVVDPFYIKVDEKSDIPVKYVASEQAQLDMKTKVQEFAENLHLQVTFVENIDLGKNETNQFNDLSVLNDWLSEKLTHEDDEVDILNTTQGEMQALAEKYGTDNFVWIGIAAFKEKERDWAKLIYGWFLGVYLPFAIADVVTPDYTTYFFTLVADSNTGEFKMSYFNAVELDDKDAIQNSNIYYIMDQIKSKK